MRRFGERLFVGILAVLLVLGALPLAARAMQLPAPGADPDWDIIRKSTEYLSFTAQRASAPDGGIPVQNLYEAYARFFKSQTLSLVDAKTINGILRKGGAEGNHVEDPGGGQLRRQNVGFYEDGRKVIDFPDFNTLPEKANRLDKMLQQVSTRALSRNEAIELAAEAHLIIGKQQLFSDGNHRTARVISDWILVRQGLPPASHFALPKDSYELELTISMKGAMEMFRRHMQQAVAAGEAQRGGGRAPPLDRPGPPKPAPAKPYGQTDWRQDSPEIERPVDRARLSLPIEPAMRIAIGSSGTHFLDDRGQVRTSKDGMLEGVSGVVAIDALEDMFIALRSDGILLRIQNGKPEQILPGRPVVSFRICKERLYAVLSIGLVVEYDGQKWRSLSLLENARQATLDSRSLLFVLNADGQAFRRADGKWNMVDDGSATRQIEASSKRLYVLKKEGHVWRSGDVLAGGKWERIDEGSGTMQIGVDDEDVYVLKNDGRVFKLAAAANQWSQIGNANARVIAMRVRGGTALGLTSTGQVVTLEGSARSETRRALFEQMEAGAGH